MKEYKYDLHVHTSEASLCASMTAEEQVRKYVEAGYDGIVVTDHFFGGNTCVDRSLPWEEKAALYAKGYEHAKALGDKLGLKVFFGIEQGYHSTDMLLYGLSPEWVIANPEMNDWNIPETYEAVHAAGGMMVHAHPMREASYITRISLWPHHVDAVEVWNNGNHLDLWNENAEKYAKDHNFPMTGGGDTHNLPDIPGGIVTHEPLNSIKDYIKLVMERGDYTIIRHPHSEQHPDR